MTGRIASSLRLRLLLPVPVFAVAVLLVLAVLVPSFIVSNTRQAAISNATQTVNQFKVIRGYYTQSVVSVVLGGTDIDAITDHVGNPDAIPLPATFVHDVSDLIAHEDTTVRLFSAYPFPNRADRVLDDFQQQAWEQLNAEPDGIVTREERLDGRNVLRVAVSDLMVDQTCIDCHNSHPQSPRMDWELGQVRGVLEVQTVLDEAYASARSTGWFLVLVATALLLGLALVFVLLANSVVKPLQRMISAIVHLSKGERVVDVSDADRSDEIGDLARALEVFKDMDAQRTEDKLELQRYALELERSNRELNVFASAASHDLQEPLRKVQTFGERLGTKYGDVLDDTGRVYIERMVNAATRMRTLIDDLLTFSRVNDSNTKYVPVNLDRVMDDVLEDLSDRVEEVGAVVERETLPELEADATQMHVLFMNLLSNALKYRSKTDETRIRIRCVSVDSEEEGRIEIEIEDNGIGFEQRHADRIFGMFERLHTRQEFDGTGVGLATCAKIVERHSGQLTASGEPGVGAVFRLNLPIRQEILS